MVADGVLTTFSFRMRGPQFWVIATLLGLLVVQAVVTTTALREAPGAPLHPDDAIVIKMAPYIAQDGRPAMPLLVPDGGAKGEYIVSQSGTRVSGDEAVIATNPGIHGRGIATFYLAAGFERLGPGVGEWGAPIVALGFTLALFVLLRNEFGTGSALVGVLLAVGAPAFLFWSNLLFSDVAAISYFVGALALLSLRRVYAVAVAAAILLLVLAFFTRVEYIVGGLAAIGVAMFRMREPGNARATAVGLIAGVALTAALMWGARELLLGERWFDPSTVWAAFWEGGQQRFGGRSDWPKAIQNIRTYIWGFGMVGVAAALASVPMLAASRKKFLFTLPLLVQACGMLIYFSGERSWGFDHAWFDSNYTRHFLIIYTAFAVLVGAALGPVFDDLRRMRPWVAPLLAILILVPGVATAYEGERGIDWLVDHRHEYRALEATAQTLPEDAIIIGDVASLAVSSRPVMRSGAYKELDRQITANRSVFIARGWMFDDTFSHPASTLLGRGYLFRSTDFGTGNASYLEIERTRVDLRGAAEFDQDSWVHENGTLTTTADVSTFRILLALQTRQALATAKAVRVTMDYLDDAPREYRGGFINQPYTPDHRRVEFQWEGLGTGGWKTAQFELPPGEVVNGPYWFSQGLTVRKLHVSEV